MIESGSLPCCRLRDTEGDVFTLPFEYLIFPAVWSVTFTSKKHQICFINLPVWDTLISTWMDYHNLHHAFSKVLFGREISKSLLIIYLLYWYNNHNLKVKQWKFGADDLVSAYFVTLFQLGTRRAMTKKRPNLKSCGRFADFFAVSWFHASWLVHTRRKVGARAITQHRHLSSHLADINVIGSTTDDLLPSRCFYLYLYVFGAYITSIILYTEETLL